MKKSFTLLFFAILFSGVTAQTLTISPDELVYDSKQGEIKYFLDVTNNTDETLLLYWKYEEAADFPDGWISEVCDVNLCYTEYPLQSNPNLDLSLGAGETMLMTVTVDHFEIPGESSGKLVFYDDNEFSNEVGRTICQSVNTEELKYSQIELFPNPSTDYFQISEDDEIKEVLIYNLVGKELAQFYHRPGKSYNITNLESGLYIVSLLDKEGELMKTLRLRK